jgi:activator of 2-hydroxyglutaryl-CoA dehydratase
MGTMAEVWVKKETLKKMYETLDKKGEQGISLTISIADEMNKFQQNVDLFVKQTKEQQEAKIPRFYVANGGVFWSNSSPLVITKQMREEAKNGTANKPSAPSFASNDSDLPF